MGSVGQMKRGPGASRFCVIENSYAYFEFTAGEWNPVHPKHRADGMYSFPIVIEDNVWIGANVVVMPGVTIGENSVIGAGSVVTKDIPANMVAFGSPCKIYREINEHDEEYYFKDRRFEES